MLLKYPGLTLVAGFTLAIGIPVGMYPLHLMSAFETPLPFEESERVLVLRHVEETSSHRQRVPFQDFVRWREGLTSFESLGAATIGPSYNIISGHGRAAPVQGAEVTASVFDILGARPALGRTLVPEDEVPGAADVVVISHDLWESRLGGDPDVVGRDIRIGGVPQMVSLPIGLMNSEAAMWSASTRRSRAAHAARTGQLLRLWDVGEIRTGSPFVLTLLLGIAAMLLIGLLAGTAPTLRALRIAPTEALREGG